MAVPKSFEAFRRLFEDIGDPALPEPDEEKEKEPETELDDKKQEIQDILEIACDAILADLHDNEMLRDAVISSIANVDNHSLMLIISPTLDMVSDLKDFLNEHPRIKKYAMGGRKINGEFVRVVKIEPVPVKDECDPPDPKDRKKKEQEQNELQQSASGEEDSGLNSTFAGQGTGL